jgi:FkbM family methyltransferase
MAGARRLDLRPSPVAQAILSAALSDHRVARTVGQKARWLLVRHGDPLVEIRVAQARLLAPLSHERPIYQRHFTHYDTALPRLAQHLQAERGTLAVVNVGANIGETAAALLAAPGITVLAIEGDERFFQLLAANAAANAALWGDRLTAVHGLLGVRSEVLAAAIEVGRGTGRLQAGNGTMALSTLADVVDDHPAFRDAGLLKIDADGFDIAILRGAREWLAAAQPVLVFEYDPHFWRPVTPDGTWLFGELAELGYGPLIAYDNFGWLLWSGTVQDRRRLEELEAWLSGRDSSVYLDLCVFPVRESLSHEHFRASELQRFTKR